MRSFNRPQSAAARAAASGLALAASVGLSALESVLSAGLMPGMRIGLSNIVIMTAVIWLGVTPALSVSLLKSGFVFLTRGITAGIMSLSGGIMSFAAMVLLIKKTKRSYIFISSVSAVAHTAGQLIPAVFITGSPYVLYYAPLLLTVSVSAGICTGIAVSRIVVSD